MEIGVCQVVQGRIVHTSSLYVIYVKQYQLLLRVPFVVAADNLPISIIREY